jgi:hypothetical protein
MTSTTTNTVPFWIVVAAWAVLAFVLNILGVFAPRPDRPPLAFLLSVSGPPIIFAIAYTASTNVRNLALSLDLRLLTAIQAWRIVGVMFLVLMSHGLLPGTFAWPAGVGDMIVGAYAPFVVVAMSRQIPGWQKHAVFLNVLGLLDFVGAIGGGILSGGTPIGVLRGAVTSDIMQELPLSMIPTFAVPFWIILHVISLIKLRNPQVASDPTA